MKLPSKFSHVNYLRFHFIPDYIPPIGVLFAIVIGTHAITIYISIEVELQCISPLGCIQYRKSFIDRSITPRPCTGLSSI